MGVVARAAEFDSSGSPEVAGAKSDEQRSTRKLPKAVWVGAICLALAIGAVTLLRHWFFLSTDYDMAFYAHAISQIAAGEWTNTMFGFHVFADHFSPLLILLAPLSFIAPAEGLLVVQALAVGSAVIPAFRLGQSVAGTRVGYLAAIWFGLSASIWHTVLYDFRPATLGVVAMLWMIAEMETLGRLPVVAGFAAIAAIAREDVAVLAGVAVLIYAGVNRRKSLLPLGAACIGLGVWYSTIGVRLFAPFDHFLWYRYADYGWSPVQVLGNLDYAVPTAISRMLRPDPLFTLAALLVPVLIVPVLVGWRYSWPGFLVWFSNAISADPSVSGIFYQYYSAAVVFFLWGAVHGFRNGYLRNRSSLGALAAIGVFIAAGPLGLVLPGHDQRTVASVISQAERRAISEVVRTVPEAASLSASRFLLPHMSSNPNIRPFPIPLVCSSVLLSYSARTEFPEYLVIEDSDVEGLKIPLEEFGYELTRAKYGISVWTSTGRHPEPTVCPPVGEARAGMFERVEDAAQR